MRGDIVIVDFEQLKPAAKVRPAIVVQSDEFNHLLTDTIVAQITGNISRAFERTQLLINENHPDWTQSGLRMASVVNAASLFTIDQSQIVHTIGELSFATMAEVDECLRVALGL